MSLGSDMIAPPFTRETAIQKVKVTQAVWNKKDPKLAVADYADDCVWRTRHLFFKGQEGVEELLTKKWEKEKFYKLRKEMFLYSDDQIAVQFWYEYFDESTKEWKRVYGLEDWTFHPDGKLRKCQMCGNELVISEDDRWFREDWTEEQVNAIQISEQHW